MTTIAYRSGILAADSRVTVHSDEGGARVFKTTKLFRKSVTIDGQLQEVILATAGESSSGMAFVDWFGAGREPPELFVHGDADFTVLVLTKDGLFEYDKWCRGEKVLEDFYAIGSGAKVAMGAMEMGASAMKAVEVACRRDPYSAPPIVTMRLARAKLPMPQVRKADDKERPHSRREAPLGLPGKRARKPDGKKSEDSVPHDNQPEGNITPGPGRLEGSLPRLPKETPAGLQALHRDGSSERDAGT